MFDLHKAIEKYKGIPPYASELYGVYQPLLGWKSNLTKKWIQHGGTLIDPRIQSILDAYIKPGPQKIQGEYIGMVASPLEPGTGHGTNPYTVLLTKDLNSELLNIIRVKVWEFVGKNDGKLPEGSQWGSIIDINQLMGETEDNILRQVNDIHRVRLIESMKRQDENWPQNETLRAMAEAELLKLMQYESQIAAFLLFYAEGQEGRDPNELKNLFFVQKAPPLNEILRSFDPLASIDPNDKSGALSPVGLVHIFRQYFFDLGTFLGEPVEHIWLAPGTTIELVEISTRKEIVERTLEQMIETSMRSERTLTLKDEISEATKQANENSTKLGVSQSNTVNLYVYQGTATANFGVETSRSTSRETAHKQNRDQTEKLSEEIKQSFKSVFRTVTETTDTTSRRHVIENRGDELINYELRRKMRRVGVQVQDNGVRLCWQVFIDEPGKNLGLSNLVHIAKPADLQPQPNQNKIDYPPNLKKSFEVEAYWRGTNEPRHITPGKNYILLNTLPLPVEPEPGYEIENPDGDVALHIKSYGGTNFHGDPWTIVGKLIGSSQLDVGVVPPPKGTLKWEYGVTFVVVGEVVFVPTADAKIEIDAANTKIIEEGLAATRAQERLTKEAFYKAAKERIELASIVKSRPSWDLREEERTVVYRELIQRLMLDSWDADTEENRPLSHVRSEIVRSLFDVDSMLYFVAPEWWMPRKHYSQFIGRSPVKRFGFGKLRPSHGALGNEMVVNWSDNEVRPDNYYITDKSQPAKLGSSLGWLLQLDGDNLRNAFLNAPWVKAVIPIRPGREKAALNWLRAVAEGDDGWEVNYLGTEPEFAGKKIGEVLEIIANRLEQENSKIENVLKSDEVFETGFNHLQGGFDAGLAPHEVFSQWISVLPTDQIVAVKYEPTDLLTT